MGNHEQALRLLPTVLHRLEQRTVQPVRQRHVEVGDVAQRRRPRIERAAQVGDLRLHALATQGHLGKRHRALVRHGPYIGRVLGHIGGDQRLAGPQAGARLLDRRRLRIDELGVVGKAMLYLTCEGSRGAAQFVDANA